MTRTGAATEAGVLFPATEACPAYLSRNDHRHFANPARNRWAASCQPLCEDEIFQDAHENAWRDSRPQLWGVRPGLTEVGTEGECLAKFPDPQNDFDAWHGYPISALDEGRAKEHQPEAALVARWLAAGLISDFEAARINRGRI